MTELVRTIYKSCTRIHNTLQFHSLIFRDSIQKALIGQCNRTVRVKPK